ncbi:MAG: Sjogren's syndrome/scleroderma autoantigen 1 family protein [Candidatus Hodarchaeales archaeon]
MEEEKDRKEANLSRMSNLLLSGATMLGEACPDCNVPLFKSKDRIFCPQCERKAVYAKDDTEVRQIEQNLSLNESTSQLKDILIGKINFLANQLASADDPQQIIPILEMIEKMLVIIQKIS